MTLTIQTSNQFKKDIRLAKKRGKNFSKLQDVIKLLECGSILPREYCNHKLTGNYKNRWECHLEPDWLLIYTQDKHLITLERTGSHSDLFG